MDQVIGLHLLLLETRVIQRRVGSKLEATFGTVFCPLRRKNRGEISVIAE